MTAADASRAMDCAASPAGARLLFAFAAGAVSATGFAPLEFFPALLLGYAVLVLLLDGADGSAPAGAPRRRRWAGPFSSASS